MFRKTIDRLDAELMELQRQLKVDIPRELQKAAAHGDLSENAEYDAARERKRMTEVRLSQIGGRIRQLKSIDPAKIATDCAGLGSIVMLEDLDSGTEITYELVFADEVDAEVGKISVQAPIGRALMGKQVDDDVSVVLPAGKKEFIVLKVTTIHERKF